MIAADVGRMLLLLCVPAFALAGTLRVEFVYIVSAGVSILSLFYEVAYRSVLPSLVRRENLLEANSKLATTASLAEIGGPAIAGLLIQWISAPLAIFFDAISFLFSATSVAAIHTPESPPIRPTGDTSIWHEIVEGFGVITSHPTLRMLAVGETLRAFFGTFIGTLYGLYALRVLGLTPGTLGFIIAAGGIGAFAGTLLASRLPRRYGLGRTLTGALLIGGGINLFIPIAGGAPLLAASMLIVGQIIGDAAMMVYSINEISLRQMLVPDRLLGRANASIGFLTQGIAPVGALAAGAIAGAAGERWTLWIAVLGILFTAIWTHFSTVRSAEVQVVVEGAD